MFVIAASDIVPYGNIKGSGSRLADVDDAALAVGDTKPAGYTIRVYLKVYKTTNHDQILQVPNKCVLLTEEKPKVNFARTDKRLQKLIWRVGRKPLFVLPLLEEGSKENMP